MTQNISRQKGIAQFLVIAIMAFMALGIPTATKLVQQNQENRSKAAEENVLPTIFQTNTPAPRPIGSTDVSFFHNFAPKDYSIRKIGSVLVNDILIKTGDRKVDSATIVYCYTDLLKPDFNSISGEQIASVISNEEIGNNCAKVKVTFNDKEINDSFSPYRDLKGYIISYKATVIKYGKGTLGISCAKSSLIGKEGKNILVNDPNCGYSNGTEFTINDPQKVSPTPTRKPTPTPSSTSGIKVSPTSLKLNVGQSQNLTATLSPVSSTDKIAWSSSNLDIASIAIINYICPINVPTDGPATSCNPETKLQVTGKKAGTVKIKATTSSGESAEATVIITNETKTTPPPKIPGAYLYFNPQKQNHKVGETFMIAIGVDSNFNAIGGVDAKGGFDSSKLELLSINNSPSMVFSEKGECEISKDSPLGKFAFTCFDYDSSQSKAIKGELVYLTFKTKSAGTAKIEFLCKENSTTDSNIQSSNTFGDIIVCNKNINANIEINGPSQTKVNGKCSASLNKCLSGTFKDLPDTSTQLIWQCSGTNGGISVKCSTKNSQTDVNGACGDTTKIVTNTCVSGKPKDLPDTIKEYIWDCVGTKKTQRCVKIKGSDDHLCPPNQYNHWGKCENDLDIGGGCDRNGVCKSGKCDLTTSRCIPNTTSIRINPSTSQLKVGKTTVLTATLSPVSSTDKIAWSSNNYNIASIKIVNISCPTNIPTAGPATSCKPGMKVQVTGKKAGTVKIKAKTSSGQTAEATIIVQK